MGADYTDLLAGGQSEKGEVVPLDRSAVGDWIREVGTALKGAQFYPQDHPRMVAVTDRLTRVTGRLVKAGDRLALGVAQGRLMLGGEFLEDTGPIRGLAAHLHQRGILTMTVTGGVESAEFRELLAAFAIPIETVRGAGGLVPLLAAREASFDHVVFTPLDYQSLLQGDDDGEKVTEAKIWEGLFKSFTEGERGLLPDNLVPMMERAMLHPESLARSLEGYATEGGALSGGKMISVMKGMVRYFRQSDPEEGELAGSSLARIVTALSAEARAKILLAADTEGFPLPELISPFVDGGERHALMSSLSSDAKEPGARLVNLFLRLGGEDGESLVDAVSEGLAAQGVPPEALHEIAASMERLLAEAKKDFVGRNYGQTLQQLMLRGGTATKRFIAPVLESLLPDLDGPIIRREILSIEMGLYQRAETPQAREELLRSIAGAAAEHLQAGDVVSLRAVTSFLAGICKRESGGQEAETVRRAIPESAVEQTLAVVRDLDKPQQEAYLPVLGDLAVLHHQGLLAILGKEQDRGVRRLIIQVLVSAGSDIVPDIVPKLKDPRWFVVRNMITVLREIAPPNLFRLLEMIQDHPDLRVRKEIIKTAGIVKGPQATKVLLEFIGDESEEIRETAIYYAGISRSPELLSPLAAIVRRGRLFNPETATVKAAVLALGQFQRPEAVDTLVWVARRRAFFHREHWRIVKAAADSALAGMRTAEAANG
jgi:predicted protein tyrosine phosphatase